MSSEQDRKKIEGFLESVRPKIRMDGGDVEFVSYSDGVVTVRLHGACSTCPLSAHTLKMGIEEGLKELISDLVEVVSVE